MAYEWDDDLATGHEMIDGQHKQLIASLNRLIDACSEGKGSAELGNVLEFLNAYIIKHFGDEEKIMERYDYSEYLYHKRYHDEFKAAVRELTSRLLEAGPTDTLVGEVHSSVAGWLVNHIRSEDFKLAAFIRTQHKK
ncbi:MAG: hemerythrin family protein, partial [Synergistaceae bacterium]|jgi:hemerythrin|nr:hemerythrin family protein [Synergistaceae bacterium]